jgi:flagellar basal-body rod protein FlgF
MDSTSYIAASRAVGLERQMATVATNLANLNTSGYRAEHLAFETVLERAGAGERLAFVQDRGTIADPAPASLVATGNALDLAIDGEGYFALQTPAGVRYSRSGHFVLDAEQFLATREGHRVLDADGAEIQLPDDAGPITVAVDGTIAAGADIFGRIVPVAFEPHELVREGASSYRAEAPAQPAERFSIRQGFVTGSNVQGIGEMTRMIDTQRAFESAVRLIEAHHDLVRRAVEQTGKVGA